ncbi:hypothetical protein [Leptospira borgpetersenii]|uniref:hypothetical protein n=1 Tax=Leptospira borgpetersenii TaxID=174 RepID=UPI0007734D70|nr:hypothetical protein [Leptospira borgpetersenii]MBE8363838.1 hypothetical protein [Leptospira borgpetersenii serovar Balcanica]MBE8367840.1 hypothetical protein [Leptospira borgpetersenii serovar Balcanica]MBE8399179.1 hypothetical protein [Leptospira borgpetersenii serovar Tarassovi]MBE8402239.1 hypothetical protein [Leptospira borgpetersenii serovar Tarassovi]MBE8407433.1 hypothetical protein [Leptospira borgpetersenii serovar Tarassovi]
MRKFLLGILFLTSINLYSDKNKWIRRIPLSRGDLILEIRNNSQDTNWNEFAYHKTFDFFRALESYSGISFHEASASIFEDQKASEKYKVLLIVQDRIFLNGTRVTGYNNISGDLGTTRGIFMEPDLSPMGYPALLFHELGHFYFSDLAWLSEGLVSFLPFVLYKEKKIDLTKEELISIAEEWDTEEGLQGGRDFPLDPDFRQKYSSATSVFYNKALKVQYILYKELGPVGYRDFVKKLVFENSPRTTKEVILRLKSIRNKNWSSLLKGWVIPGPYEVYTWKTFQKESILGTFIQFP